jgi:hypothetical protein
MKSTKSFLGLAALLLAIIALVLTGCPDPNGGGGVPAPTVPSGTATDTGTASGTGTGTGTTGTGTAAFVPVTNITGVPTGATAGSDQTLSGTVVPGNATNQTITWSVYSVGTTGASIVDGKLKTTAAGTATVRAIIINGLTATDNYTQDFTITVGAEFVPVTGITGVPGTATVGADRSLSGTVIPANATNQTITWTVKTEGGTRASLVDGNKLRTTSEGTAMITAAIAGGQSAADSYTQDFAITVTTVAPPFVPVTNITGVPGAATAGIDLALSGAVTPTNATNQTIAWTVKTEGGTGASIVNGNKLRTTAAGTATITAAIADGSSASSNYTKDFYITVTLPFVAVSNISGVPSAATIGTDLTLSGTVTPIEATNRTITWSVYSAGSTGASIVSGKLRTTGAGTATVRATVANGLTASSNYTQDFTVTVSDTTAPTLSAGSVEALTTTAGTTATLKFTSNEAGTYYYLVLAAGAGAPAAATIQAQGTAVTKGSATATASQNTINVTGLTAGTQYKAYIVVKDAAGNVSAVLTISGVNPVTAGITAVLYVGASTTPQSGVSSLAGAITWLGANTTNNGAYTIELRATGAIAPTSLSYSGKTVKITLKGDTAVRTVSLSDNGSMFTLGSGVTLTLDNNVTLLGRSGNTASLVIVNSGGALDMKGTAKITGNVVSSYNPYGGGVLVSSGGSFTMSGNATITDNTASSPYSSSAYGGGVFVNGSFTMNDSATVSGNTASSSERCYGGGVYINSGSFTMNGSATISGNTASSYGEVRSSYGGGVYVYNSNFIMNDSAALTNNTASDSSSASGSAGGGVYFGGSGSFSMSGSAMVSGNSSRSIGGGVYIDSGSFTMSGNATVSNNRATWGGGVRLDGGNFSLSGSATVSGNTASYYGGGVFINNGSFTKTGGVIYGSNETNASLRNIVTGQTTSGAAVYKDSTHRRETTASTGQDMYNSGSTYTGQWND